MPFISPSLCPLCSLCIFSPSATLQTSQSWLFYIPLFIPLIPPSPVTFLLHVLLPQLLLLLRSYRLQDSCNCYFTRYFRHSFILVCSNDSNYLIPAESRWKWHTTNAKNVLICMYENSWCCSGWCLRHLHDTALCQCSGWGWYPEHHLKMMPPTDISYITNQKKSICCYFIIPHKILLTDLKEISNSLSIHKCELFNPWSNHNTVILCSVFMVKLLWSSLKTKEENLF